MSAAEGDLGDRRSRVAEPRPASVVEAFARNAQSAPQKLCLRFEGEDWSYERLLGRMQTFAAALGTWGLEPGDRVALFLGNLPDFLAAYLGTHLAGGIVVPVNKGYRRAELRHIFDDAGVRFCLADGEGRPELERVRGELPALERVVEHGADLEDFLSGAEAREFALPRGDDLAVIAYTSGTTGRSKGAMLLHRNLLANAEAIREAWRWTAEDHLLLALPLFHTHGLMVGAHGTLLAGASAELRRAFDAAEVYDALLTGDFTMFFGVPTMYTRLLREAKDRPERPEPLRLYVSGSAPLSPQAFHEFEKEFGQRILERYGMTETGMNLTNPYEGERRPGTVGMPFPGQEARVVDLETREALPAGEVGEIEVRGPHVSVGYWGRLEATAESFDEAGWFRTGDLGSVSEDGYFQISGRKKELIITGGYNVYPREIEEVLEGCSGVAEVAVVGLPDPEYGERIIAAVVRDDPALTEERVVDFCREELANYKKPRRVEFVDALPRNALGKVLKHEVREKLVERQVSLGSTQDTLNVVKEMAAAMEEQRRYLTKLDSEIGDGDHGTNMYRGFQAALERLDGADPSSPADALKAVSMALISKVGGAAGPLYGTAFLRASTALQDRDEVTAEDAAAALEAALGGIKQRGKAEVGDKTIVDALEPAAEAAKGAASSGSVAEVLRAAADAAKEGAESTVPLTARRGRASYLGPRAAGHQDPGATSTYYLLDAAARALEGSS